MLALTEFAAGFFENDEPVPVVEDVSFDIAAGEVLALVGESGSGKSFTCLGILGLNQGWRSGGARLRDIDLLDLDGRAFDRLRGRRIAMIFQDPSSYLDPVMTIGRHLERVIRHRHGHDRPAARRMSIALLEEVGLGEAEDLLGRYPHELSGGMNQRVMIALALAGEPELLIADEPTTALDATVQIRVLRLLRRLVDSCGLGLLFITHDLGVARFIADRVAVLYAGRLIETGPVDVTLSAPRHPYTRALIQAQPSLGRQPTGVVGRVPLPRERRAGCAFAPRCPQAAADCRARPRLVSNRRGQVACWRPLEASGPAAATAVPARPRPVGGAAEPIVEARALVRRFPVGARRLFGARKCKAVVDTVDLTLRRGDSLGLVGESGSGKSTVARMIAGLLKPSGGRLRVGGQTLETGVDARRLARVVQMVFQNPRASLNPRLPVWRQVADPLRVHGIGTPPSRRERAEAALARLGLAAGIAERLPQALSGGQLQRVVLARALILDPDLLVCDEPTSSLDVSVQAEVVTLLNDLRRGSGLSLLFISHDLALVSTVCDRIAVMHAGRIVETGPTAQVLNAPTEAYTRSLIEALPDRNLGPAGPAVVHPPAVA